MTQYGKAFSKCFTHSKHSIMIFAMLVVVINNIIRLFLMGLNCKEQPEQEAHRYYALSNHLLTTLKSTDPNTPTAALPIQQMVSPASKDQKQKQKWHLMLTECLPSLCIVPWAQSSSPYTPGGGACLYLPHPTDEKRGLRKVRDFVHGDTTISGRTKINSYCQHFANLG